MSAVSLRRPHVTVLGGGSWGTTVASLAARNTQTVQWARDPQTARQIQEEHRNLRYLGDLELTPALRATADLAEAAGQADVIVIGVPSHSFRSLCEQVAPFVRPWIPVVSLVKGLEQGSHRRMSQIVAEVLPGHPAGVLAGPNIAQEVLRGYAAAATIAMPDHSSAQMLQDLFRTAMYRVYTSTDVAGVELGGALKNVFAIAVGMGDGLEAGDNTRAMVITRSLREMSRLGVAMGGDPATFAGLAGMGDLITTCTSPLSRNRHVGMELGRGKDIKQITAEMNQVAEGVKTSSVVMELAGIHGIEMAIAREVDQVVNHGRPVTDAYRGLLRTVPGHEVHGTTW
ncbi:MAG TPA: NAD(P)H-dependent glycerol-3-phosphate dehydrogenase [Streptosporangiaceae bacterium]